MATLQMRIDDELKKSMSCSTLTVGRCVNERNQGAVKFVQKISNNGYNSVSSVVARKVVDTPV